MTRSRSIGKPRATEAQKLAVINFLLPSYATPNELPPEIDSLNVEFSGQQIKDMLSENPNVDGFVHSLPYSYGRAAQHYNRPYYDASEELREHFGLPSGI